MLNFLVKLNYFFNLYPFTPTKSKSSREYHVQNERHPPNPPILWNTRRVGLRVTLTENSSLLKAFALVAGVYF